MRILTRTVISSILVFTIGSRVLSQVTISPPAQRFVLRFYGDNIVQVPTTSPLNMGSTFTMECWVYLESASPYSIVMGKTTSAPYTDPSFEYILGFADSTRPRFVVSTGQPGSAQTASSSTCVPLRKWTHLAATLSGNLMRLYVNGDSVAAMTSVGAPPVDDSTPFAIGAGLFQNGTAFGFTGSLCQVRTWNRARSSTELKSSASTYLAGNEDGLTASWPLDDGGGQFARDQKQLRNLLLGISEKNRIMDPHWVRRAILETGPYFTIQEFRDTSLNLNTGRFIDFNNDGKLDLIISQSDNSGAFLPKPIVLFKNDGRGNFSNVTKQMLGAHPPTTIVAVDYPVVDINNDGLNDFLIADEGEDRSPFSGAQMRLLVQKPGGLIVDETSLRLPQQNDRASSIAVGDIDGDGFVDFYVAEGGMSPAIPHFLMNDRTGKFVKDTTRLPSKFLNYYSPTATMVDVNRDGYLDLILTKADFHEERDVMLLNDGTGHFTQAPLTSLPPEPGDKPRSYNAMRVADFNNDGWPDLVAPSALFGYGTESMLWYLINNRDGTFSDASDRIPQHWLPEDDALAAPVIADFNNDGLMDILVPGSWYRTPPQLYLNKGNGYFVDCSDLIPSDKKYYAMAAGDIDGDGKIDIVMWAGSDYAVLRNVKLFDVAILETPAIATLTPAQGPAGTTVTIQGSNLAGTNDVEFNGKSTSFRFVSDNQIVAQVPDGGSTGPVQLNTASGVVYSPTSFVVPLVIYGFYPISGVGGTTVTISGSNFTGVSAVRFGGVASPSVVVVADSQITAVVPQKAITGPITLTTPGGTFSTPMSFIFVGPPDQRYSLRFNGNQIAVAPLASQLVLGQRFTMEAWIYLEQQVGSSCILGKPRDPTWSDLHMSYVLDLGGSGKKLEFLYTTDQINTYRTATASTDCPLGSWTHVAATLDSITMRLYLNGSQVASSVASQPSQGAPNTIRFAVGNGMDKNGLITTAGFKGALTQVRVWDRALSPVEVLSQSTKYLSGNEPGLIAYWPLDDSTGQTARDLSPNKLNLTLGSTPGVDSNDPSWVRTNTLVAVESYQNQIPLVYRLEQNYPNPFNPSTTIRFQLPKDARVSLEIFNVLGQQIALLIDRKMDPGYHQVQWDAAVSSGIYFYRLQAGEFLETKKMILLR